MDSTGTVKLSLGISHKTKSKSIFFGESASKVNENSNNGRLTYNYYHVYLIWLDYIRLKEEAVLEYGKNFKIYISQRKNCKQIISINHKIYMSLAYCC